MFLLYRLTSAAQVFSGNSWDMSNSTPRVLILGHSFIKRLKQFVRNNSNDFDLDFQISLPVLIRWHGVGGRTVEKTLTFDTHVLHSFRPDVVILQLGSNDLVTLSPLRVGSAIDEFVHFLHDSCGVQLVCVCQTIRRFSAEAFNTKVGMLTRYLRVVLDPIPYAMFWGHRGFWQAKDNFYTPDGVHLNSRGQRKLYRSLRGAVLRSLRLLPSSPSSEGVC